MGPLLEGKTALILGVANKWSLAYAIAQAFRREGAALLLTYQGERLKSSAEELGSEVGAAKVFECDVTKDEHLDRLKEAVRRDLARGLSSGAGSQRIFDNRGGSGYRPAHDFRWLHDDIDISRL